MKTTWSQRFVRRDRKAPRRGGGSAQLQRRQRGNYPKSSGRKTAGKSIHNFSISEVFPSDESMSQFTGVKTFPSVESYRNASLLRLCKRRFCWHVRPAWIKQDVSVLRSFSQLEERVHRPLAGWRETPLTRRWQEFGVSSPEVYGVLRTPLCDRGGGGLQHAGMWRLSDGSRKWIRSMSASLLGRTGNAQERWHFKSDIRRHADLLSLGVTFDAVDYGSNWRYIVIFCLPIFVSI